MSDCDQICVSSNEVDENSSYQVEEELELLHSIYVHELEVKCNQSGRPEVITIDLHPATADKTEEQFVRLTLVFSLPQLYPKVVPQISIKNSRGLADDDLKKICDELNTKADQNKGSQVLYQLIELAKEYLTASNTPTGVCAICLYGFDSHDVFTKTECYHHFHSQCLARYIESTLEEIKEKEDNSTVVCPVCREVITYDMKILGSAPPPFECESAADFVITSELKLRQIQMADLLKRQQERGGIIDVEAEKNKYLLEISEDSPPSLPVVNGDLTPTISNKPSNNVDRQQTQRAIKKETVALESKNDAGASKRFPRENETMEPSNSSTNFRERGKNKFRGRGGKTGPWSRPRHNENENSPHTADQGGARHDFDRPRHPWRGRGRNNSWHQQRRQARNAEKREMENTENAENSVEREPDKKDTKPTQVSNVVEKHELSENCIQNQACWGYGPPPSRFVRDPTQSPSIGRNSSKSTPPPGFQARPPFPRTKPPPGFLAS